MVTEKTIRCFGGIVHKVKHESSTLKTEMRLNVYLPPHPRGAPVILYLAGLTCTGDNGLEKGGFLGFAAKRNVAMIFPDTSPRTSSADSVPGEHDDWDLGSGAGFYINASAQPWVKNYQMESYIMDELLSKFLPQEFPILDWTRKSICGHSMGGHGALTLYLKNPSEFKSVSAFSPISHPTVVPWGTKAFENYLGSIEAGKPHDAVEICKNKGARLPKASVLVDVGGSDQFWDQLRVLDLQNATKNTPLDVALRVHDGYDHSYFFISTFAEDHIEHHAKYLYP